MGDLYQKIASIYDCCGISDFSVTFGKSILKYVQLLHPNECFEKNIDICCGTGTLCGFFRDHGIETKGVDLSKEMLEVARKNYPDIEFAECNAKDYQDDILYDFATCTDDALQHNTKVDDVKAIFKNVNRLLRPDGLFIFDINFVAYISIGERIKFQQDQTELLYNVSREGEIVTYVVNYYENGNLIWSDAVKERDFSVDDITILLKEAGFIVEMCSQYFFDEKNDKKWKIVARKVECI